MGAGSGKTRRIEMKSHNSFDPDYAVSPGETLADLLEERDMTQNELADKLGISLEKMNGVVDGEVALTPEIADGLNEVFSIPARFWLERERQYRKKFD